MKPGRTRSTAEELQLEIFRRMTPEQRVDCALRWTATTLEFARAGIRMQYPDWTPAQVERELGRRITGIDVTKLDWEKLRRQRAELPSRLEGDDPVQADEAAT